MNVSTCLQRNEDKQSPLNSRSLSIDITYKFNLYREAAETTEKKLNEAKIVIQHLKEYVETAKEVESHLKRQLEYSGKRMIQLHKILSQFLNVSERQRHHAKTTQSIEQKLNEIDQVINKLRLKSKNVFESVSREVHLLEKNQQLERALKTTEASCQLFKVQYQTLLKEKTEMEIQFQRQVDNLQNEAEQSRREANDMKTRCDTTILIYKKQIEDHEILINEYERERQSLLEDFEIPIELETTKNITTTITCCENTVAKNTDESLCKVESQGRQGVRTSPVANYTSMGSCLSAEEINSKPALKASSCVTAPSRCYKGRALNQGGKRKTTLKSLTGQATSVPTPCVGAPTKRRLFSTNCNHYLT